MSNVRISEIANELGYPSKEIVEKAQQLGLKVKTHSNAVSLEEAEAIYEYVQSGVIPEKFKKKTQSANLKAMLKKARNRTQKATRSKARRKMRQRIKPQSPRNQKPLNRKKTLKFRQNPRRIQARKLKF